MDKSIQYSRSMANFDSAYNVSPNYTYAPTIYIPASSSSSFSSHPNRSISPSMRSSNPKYNFDLYQTNDYRSDESDYSSPSSSVIVHHHHPVYSPPPPPPSQTISKLRQLNDELCYTLAQAELTNQSLPPPPHSHHHPIPQHSYENYRSRPTSEHNSPSHHHHHHHSIPQHSYENYRSRSPSEHNSPSHHHHHSVPQHSYKKNRSRSTSEHDSSSSSVQSEPIQKKRNARISYKIRMPRQQRENAQAKLDHLLISTSDAYSHADPMTLDLYPTRDQGFVKQVRNRPDNQRPWLIDDTPARRNSYSEASTYRPSETPRAPYYNDKPITPRSRLTNDKERPRPSSERPRFRPDSVPNRLRQSAVYYSTTGPTWQPSGSIKPKKFIGSHAPPKKPKPPPAEPLWNPAGTAAKKKAFRAFDPVNKSSVVKPSEPIWHPATTETAEKIPKYFPPTLKPELIQPIQRQPEFLRKRTRKPYKAIVPVDEPEVLTRNVKGESKVKAAWESTAPETEPKPRPVRKPITVIERKPPIPRVVRKTTTTIPPKSRTESVPSPPIVPIKKVITHPPKTIDTGRSSLNDIPTKPMFQSTPLNQSIVDENNESAGDLFGNKSELSSRQPPGVEKTPTVLPKTIVPEPDKGTKATIKNGVLLHGNDTENPMPSSKSKVNNNEETLNDRSVQPSPVPPARKASVPKPDNKDDISIVDDEEEILPDESAKDDADEGVEPSFEMNESLDNTPKPTIGASKRDDVVSPIANPRTPPKGDVKAPPRRKTPPPSPPESFNDNSIQSPITSKKTNQQLPSTPAPAATTTSAANDIDDFFN